MYGRMVGSISQQMNRPMDQWMKGLLSRWMDKQMDESTDGYISN